MTSAKPVLVVAGPTASGKSALALALAQRLGGVVINADSMQVYRELAVLTARPTPDQTAQVPHRLYGVLPAAEPCSAARWRVLALAEIAAAHDSGRLPVVTGGTGLYLRALIEGLAEIPPVPEPVRAAARETLERLGAAGLHAALAARAPEEAARLRPQDRQRLLRAWEVLEATGQPLGHWQARHRQAGAAEGPPPGLAFRVLVLAPPRPALYAACDGRFRTMIAQGALEEVRALAGLGLDPALPVLKALGVPELRRHLEGELTLEAAVALGQQSTRNYAKRQTTWFRHQLAGRHPDCNLLPHPWPAGPESAAILQAMSEIPASATRT